jgi:hypothetical protein
MEVPRFDVLNAAHQFRISFTAGLSAQNNQIDESRANLVLRTT